MLEAEFDRFADQYQAQHAASIRLSGETPDYFAKYKIDNVADILARRAEKPLRVLDFGGGVGNSIGHLRSAFPASQLVLLDPSERSLDIAANRFPGIAQFQHFDGETIPFDADRFDLIFTACVFHHIPHEKHVSLLREIHRVLSPGGRFFLYEHNPLNPLTCHAVRNCPFDEGAVLIHASDMRARMRRAGFAAPRASFCFFFPRALAPLRVFERHLACIPLGAQYVVHAAKNRA